jgi:hypothetical protein
MVKRAKQGGDLPLLGLLIGFGKPIDTGRGVLQLDQLARSYSKSDGPITIILDCSGACSLSAR